MSSASSVPTGLIGECILRDRTSIPGNKPFLRLNGPILRAPQATIKGREKQSGRRGRKTYALLYSCPEHSLFVIGNLRPGAGWSIQTYANRIFGPKQPLYPAIP
jgi:hypothetical protein